MGLVPPGRSYQAVYAWLLQLLQISWGISANVVKAELYWMAQPKSLLQNQLDKTLLTPSKNATQRV